MSHDSRESNDKVFAFGLFDYFDLLNVQFSIIHSFKFRFFSQRISVNFFSNLFAAAIFVCVSVILLCEHEKNVLSNVKLRQRIRCFEINISEMNLFL